MNDSSKGTIEVIAKEKIAFSTFFTCAIFLFLIIIIFIRAVFEMKNHFMSTKD